MEHVEEFFLNLNFVIPPLQVHTFLVYSIVMCTAAMTLEIFVRNDVRGDSGLFLSEY